MRVRLLRLLLLAAAESALAAAPSCAPSPSGPSPITQHITSPDSSDAPDLVRQSLEPIARDATQRTRERRVPHAPPATIDQGRLEWEYAETRAFLDKQLNHDPRLQPTDIVVDTDHMRRCTSCAHDRGLHDVLTGDSGGAPETVAGSIDVGGRTQLLVDDYVIAAWRNVVRVLEPPKRKRALDSSLDAHGDYRFGCPCSTFEDAEGNVRLYYQSGPSIYGGEEDTWEEDHNGRYSFRISPDGETGWSEEHGPIRINGRDGLGTMSVEAGKRGAAYSLPPRSGHAGTEGGMLFVSGYEGWRSRACLAFSSDGRDFYNLDDEADRRNPGLNDDCLSAPGVRGSNSVFARAADTYVLPVVDLARGKEYVWWRKDFGTAAGWREVRGMQVAELDRRFAEIPSASTPTGIRSRSTEWYLDRLGKLERYRRHAYTVALTPYDEGLWLGVMAVIEWPKDLSEPRGGGNPAFERDTLNLYLVTSRDGVHIDHEWLYAHQPLISKRGLTQSDFDGGLLFPAAGLLTREREHRIYFEARAGIRHEERYDGNRAAIGTAAWDRDRMVALRPAHLDVPAVLTTRPFRLVGSSRWARARLSSDVMATTTLTSPGREMLSTDSRDPGAESPHGEAMADGFELNEAAKSARAAENRAVDDVI